MISSAVANSSATGWIESPYDMPKVPGLLVPEQFYWLKTGPAPLAGMPLPIGPFPWKALSMLGFTKVVCLCSETRLYDPSPLRQVVRVELEDPEEGPPSSPLNEGRRYVELADRICGWVAEGDGVVVHCAAGRTRTGTLLGTVMVKQGFTARHVASLLNRIHRARGRGGWPKHRWSTDLLRSVERGVQA